MQSTHVPLTPQVVLPLAVQVPFAQQKPPEQVPSPALPHSAMQEPIVQVGVAPTQPLQASPSLPQAPLSVPGAHVPAAQQPPLQGAVGLHVVPHLPIAHAWPGAQSVACVQPQTPVARQISPSGLVVQSTQAPPFEPQVALLLAAQFPALQQPPLQRSPPVQEVPHMWLEGSHA